MKITTQLISDVATGTAPFSVASTTLVPNLNVEKWGGQNLPSIAANGGKVLAVNAGATALEWITAGGGGTTTNALTINNGGAGAASGSTFNGSAAVTISYNTVGASPLAGNTSLITVGTVTTGTWSATDIAVASGGTGASTAAAARTNLATPTIFIQAGTPTATNTGDIWFIP